MTSTLLALGLVALGAGCATSPGVEEVSSCGNGKLDPGEACDGSEHGAASCESLGFGPGALACTADCHLESSGCGSGAGGSSGGGSGCGNGSVDDTSCAGPCLGDGGDGVLSVAESTTLTWDAPRARVVARDGDTLALDTIAGNDFGGEIAVGDEVLILQVTHDDPNAVGGHAWARVIGSSWDGMVIDRELPASIDPGAGSVQLTLVPSFESVTIAGKLKATPWSATAGSGGVVAFRSRGAVTIEGMIDAVEAGLDASETLNPQNGQSGTAGTWSSGGGGGHAVVGDPGAAGGALGGQARGSDGLARLTFGGAGGRGQGPSATCVSPPAGGGIVSIAAESIVVTGSIAVDGATRGAGVCGADGSGGVGGSAGGSVALEAGSLLSLGVDGITARGGAGGVGTGSGSPLGGKGSKGRIAVECHACTPEGTTAPTFVALDALRPARCGP